MLFQCFAVIAGIIAEDGSASVKLTAISHQEVPIVMSDFVSEMTKQGAIWLTHLQAPALAFDMVSFRKRNGDHAVVVASQDFLAAHGIVGKEVKYQSVLR